MASQILSYLPPAEGLLPKWLLFIAVVSIGNSIQAYTTLYYTARVYNPNSDNTRLPSNLSVYTNPSKSNTPTKKSPSSPPGEIPSQVTPLSARTFGTWTMLTSMVRLYAAYNITTPGMYSLAVWTYVIALVHFVGEWCVFKTTRWGTPLAGPVIVSTMSLTWMFFQKDYYLGQ